ncbi:MAG: zf-HC2 domain-containing protein [Proteobacteria bacterium]|nr:zf-HC2 domain-containing protein [Pseudomonadota bacterium]
MMFKLPLMITCSEFESFILAYLEGDLAPRQKSVFEFHLKICRECRDYLTAYRASLELAKDTLGVDRNYLEDHVPEDLIKAILAARRA